MKYRENSEKERELKSFNSINTLLGKNKSKALSELEHHLERFPNDVYAYNLYGKLCFETEQLEAAEFAYEKVAKSKKSIRFSGLIGLGEIYRRRNNLQAARTLYQKVIQESPREELYAIYSLARVERLSGNYDLAIRILDSASTQTVDMEIERQKISIAQNGPLASTEKFSSILTTSKTQSRMLALEQAKSANATGDFAKARYYFIQAKDTPDKDTTYYRAVHEEARMFLQTKEYEEAVANCLELLSVGKTYKGNVYYVMARASQALNRVNDAIKYYKMAIENNNESDTLTLLHYQLGLLELAIGDTSSAEEDFKANIEINKKQNRYRINPALSLLLNMYLNQERYIEAEKLIDDLSRTNPDILDKDMIDEASLIIRRKTNRPTTGISIDTYRKHQLASYRESDVIGYITNNNQNNSQRAVNIANNISVSHLLEEVKIRLTAESRLFTDILDTYLIDYPNVGYTKDGTIINQLSVTVIPGTKDIINMYPNNSDSLTKRLSSTKDKEDSSQDRIKQFNSRFTKYKERKGV